MTPMTPMTPAPTSDRWRSLSLRSVWAESLAAAAGCESDAEGNEIVLRAGRPVWTAVGLISFRLPAQVEWNLMWGIEYAERMAYELCYDAIYLFEYGGTP